MSLEYEGYRFSAPFRCMCCGVEVSEEQFNFGRACGICDAGLCMEGDPQSLREAYEAIIPGLPLGPEAERRIRRTHEKAEWWLDWGHTREQKLAAYAKAVHAEPSERIS